MGESIGDMEPIATIGTSLLGSFTKCGGRRRRCLSQFTSQRSTGDGAENVKFMTQPRRSPQIKPAPFLQEASAEQLTPIDLNIRATGKATGVASTTTQASSDACVHVEGRAQLEAASSRRSTRRKGAHNKLWCHVHINEDALKLEGFDLIPRLIGSKGKNTRDIWEKTGTKVRVRGRGSGHIEQNTGKEAPSHLMMAIAAEHGRKEDFRAAVARVKGLLEQVFMQIDEHCQQHRFSRSRHSDFWIGEFSDVAFDSLIGLSFPPAPAKEKAVSAKPKKNC